MRKFNRAALDELRNLTMADLQAEEEYAAKVRADLQEFADDAPLTIESREENNLDSLIDEVSVGLARDGRDFIAALCWMATGAGFTAPSISLLLAVAAYEDCQEKDERGCEITDPELADFKGCSERTIQRWRQQYLKEEKYLEVPFLQITEGDYDKEARANRPTRYRFLVDTAIADAVLEARQMNLYLTDRRKALRLSALRVFDSLEKGQSAIRRRKKKELSPDSERNRLLNTLRTCVAKLKDIDSKMDCEFDWEAVRDEMDAIYKSDNPRQVVAEIKHNPMGRHNVAPSVAPSTVSAQQPSAVLVVTIKKEKETTSIEHTFISREELYAGANFDEALQIPAVVRYMRGARASPDS